MTRVEPIWRRKCSAEFDITQCVENSWRSMYARLFSGWAFLEGEWSLHVSGMYFPAEHHFSCTNGAVPHATAKLINIHSRRFVVHRKRLMMSYAGVHFQIPQMGLVTFFVEPVDEKSLTAAVSPVVLQHIRDGKVRLLFPMERWCDSLVDRWLHFSVIGAACNGL